MHYTQIHFDRKINTDFKKTLNKRVNQYFKDTNRSKKANAHMLIKSVFMVALFLVPYALLYVEALHSSIFLFLGLWALMGLGKAGIGMNVMHDANHGAYSNNPLINKILGASMDIIGGNSSVWKFQHNVLHHTFTNIDGLDEDIDGPPVLRFSPNQKWRPIHRYQHILAWMIYPLMTLVKLLFTDFQQAYNYRKNNLITSNLELAKILTAIAVWRSIYIGYILIIPIMVLPVSPWLVVGGMLLMHFITGFILAVVFQAAHVMPEMEYPSPQEGGQMEYDWTVHQIMTTTDFAPKNKFLSWCVGGLNFQVEHHLFPTICHVHYPALAMIVKKTADDFEVPYQSEKTFTDALISHGRMLYTLGKKPVQRAA